ncbi:unnamed protein product [Allacma fusca]|uniref:Uncharacterized protein n=1 Tax=Allacma fusca TaxID=39272 RepID=A0A8J2NRY1_9HEXA|nr:unnamed protein product [Allacma fusca]
MEIHAGAKFNNKCFIFLSFMEETRLELLTMLRSFGKQLKAEELKGPGEVIMEFGENKQNTINNREDGFPPSQFNFVVGEINGFLTTLNNSEEISWREKTFRSEIHFIRKRPENLTRIKDLEFLTPDP